MDREKVISTLEDIKTQTAGIGLDSAVIANEFIDKIIAMLKEKETANIYKCPNCGTWVSAKNVVRCEDCKYGKRLGYLYECENELHKPDWFCADWKRK